MTRLVRHVALLVASMVFFFVVLGALLWGRHLAIAQSAERINELLAPSQTQVARAQRALVALQSMLYQRRMSARPLEAIPYRLDVLRGLDGLDQHIARVARLAHAFDYRNAFDLPGRARMQLDIARESLLLSQSLATQNAAEILAFLAPLQGTLQQLERIYEIDERRSSQKHGQLVTNSLYIVAITAVMLIIVISLLVSRLVFDLRDTVRQETRIRTDLEEATRDLEVLAMYDSLTRLGNRRLFKTRLEETVSSASRSGRFAALMYIDLDDFKRINDSLGHDAGDEVLKIVGKRLAESVRSSDTVARIGGDEFTVLLSDMASQQGAGAVAATLLERIHEPMRIVGHEVVVSGSIGITIMPTDGDDPEVLLKNADIALYRAKAYGRRNFQFFVETMNRNMHAQMVMEGALRAAIREEGFALAYQPQVDLATGKVTCLEALLRWPQSDGTIVPPDEFIPLAETTGLMTEIGAWVLIQACRDLARLRRTEAPELRMSINLSARQFLEPHLAARIQHALETNALAPSALEVEITETTLIEDITATRNALENLRALGISIAIDDFGIGYSSLNYLKQLPIDALKVDRSFVRDIETDEADRSIVDAVLAMAHSLSLRVVAEGIETEWQLNYLAGQRCSEGQGFLFSRPVPVGELRLAEIRRRWTPVLAPRVRHGLQVVE